jgi:hypothetical protein
MSNSDADAAEDLTSRIERLEHEIAALRAERETALTGWPNETTQAQGFLGHRWQRRDGDSYDQALANIPEAPYDQNYYGRYQGTWQPVVEEAPAATARLSTTGWARASAGSAVTWLSLDDTFANYATLASLSNYVTEVPIGAGAYARVRAPGGDTGWTDVDALYLAKSGGQMTGPLITIPGTGPTNPGLGVGDNSTGFYRPGGGLLNVTVAGVGTVQFMPSVTALFVTLDLGRNRIMNVADAAADADALNRQSGDARYLQPNVGGFITGPLQLLFAAVAPNDAVTKGYVDQRRAPAVVFDLPENIQIPGDSVWHRIADVPFAIPRGGTSLVGVTVSCNVTDFQGVAIVGVRFAAGSQERQVFAFGGGATPSSGFVVEMAASWAAVNFPVPIEVISLPSGGAAPVPFTIIGGAGALRSQITIVDLGPVS